MGSESLLRAWDHIATTMPSSTHVLTLGMIIPTNARMQPDCLHLNTEWRASSRFPTFALGLRTPGDRAWLWRGPKPPGARGAGRGGRGGRRGRDPLCLASDPHGRPGSSLRVPGLFLFPLQLAPRPPRHGLALREKPPTAPGRHLLPLLVLCLRM